MNYLDQIMSVKCIVYALILYHSESDRGHFSLIYYYYYLVINPETKNEKNTDNF